MHPAEALVELGGVSAAAPLLRLTSRRQLRKAIEVGDVVHLARDRYGLRTGTEGLLAAGRLSGVASHLSAAAHYQWPVLDPPPRPHVTVPRTRHVLPSRQRGVRLHWKLLDAKDWRVPGVTEPMRTVLDCSRDLPFADALAVADSALRSGLVDQELLGRAAQDLRGRGAAQARRVAQEATPLADNPFESALRAICLDVPGLEVWPQVTIELAGRSIRPDLVDSRLRIIVEADSFAFHSSAAMLLKDCERYTIAAAEGWRVARFGYRHVRREQHWVRDMLSRTVAQSVPRMSARS